MKLVVASLLVAAALVAGAIVVYAQASETIRVHATHNTVTVVVQAGDSPSAMSTALYTASGVRVGPSCEVLFPVAPATGTEADIAWEQLSPERVYEVRVWATGDCSRTAIARPQITKHLSLIHISEPTRLLSISYAVFCLKK